MLICKILQVVQQRNRPRRQYQFGRRGRRFFQPSLKDKIWTIGFSQAFPLLFSGSISVEQKDKVKSVLLLSVTEQGFIFAWELKSIWCTLKLCSPQTFQSKVYIVDFKSGFFCWKWPLIQFSIIISWNIALTIVYCRDYPTQRVLQQLLQKPEVSFLHFNIQHFRIFNIYY